MCFQAIRLILSDWVTFSDYTLKGELPITILCSTHYAALQAKSNARNLSCHYEKCRKKNDKARGKPYQIDSLCCQEKKWRTKVGVHDMSIVNTEVGKKTHLGISSEKISS